MKTLRSLLAIAVAAFASVASPAPAAPRPDDAPYPRSFTRALVGKIGDRDVHMVLSYFEGSLEGDLFFVAATPALRSWSSDLDLHGTLAPDGSFEMECPGDSDTHYSPRPNAECSGPAGTLRGTMTGSAATRDEPIQIEGTWTGDDDTTYPFALAERVLPDGSKVRLRSRTLDETLVAEQYRYTLVTPELVGRGGRPDQRFARAVRRYVARTIANFRSNADQGEPSEDMSTLDVDYEVVYASDALVSVVFREHADYTQLLPHVWYTETCITFDIRRGVELDLARQMRPGTDAARAIQDAIDGLVAASDLAEDSFIASRVGRLRDWAVDEHGLVLCESVENSSGSSVQVHIPWAFVRRSLAASSPLVPIAFPPRRVAAAHG